MASPFLFPRRTRGIYFFCKFVQIFSFSTNARVENGSIEIEPLGEGWLVMLSKCANPSCDTVFRYLREGKLFEFDTNSLPVLRESSTLRAKRTGRVEYFWLCAKCMSEMTLVVDRDRGVVTVPLHRKSSGGAAA